MHANSVCTGIFILKIWTTLYSGIWFSLPKLTQHNIPFVVKVTDQPTNKVGQGSN